MVPGEHPHRKRCKRYDIEGHAHYLTFSCWRQLPLLSRDRSRLWFVESLRRARAKHGFDLWAYVIMPEHVHLVILPPPGGRISAILKSIKQPVTQRAIRWVRRNAPHFLNLMRDRQPSGACRHRFWLPGGGYDRNIWTVSELHEKIAYVHANPVRRGLVDDPADWPWSSWPAWETGIDEPLPIDRESLPPIER